MNQPDDAGCGQASNQRRTIAGNVGPRYPTSHSASSCVRTCLLTPIRPELRPPLWVLLVATLGPAHRPHRFERPLGLLASRHTDDVDRLLRLFRLRAYTARADFRGRQIYLLAVFGDLEIVPIGGI